ncbi:MAG: exonuclease subunit SbcD [Treponemataceae bacterium]|nr:exonuclease subunit SbcD [Treponemataceae bacterium]
MRFIHTADWHLGNSMYHVDRSSEADSFFLWLRSQILAEKADVLIVSGDIFDTVNPPTEARKKYFSFLSSLKDTCCKSVVITGGNHDSGSLLDAPASVLEDMSGLSVHVVGSMVDRSVEDAVFELYDASGSVCGICAALPYMREMDVRRLMPEADSDVESLFGGVYAQVLEAAEKLRSGRNIPLIATGHLYAADLEGRNSFEDGLSPQVGNGSCSKGWLPFSNGSCGTSDDSLDDLDEELSDDGVRPLDIVGKLGRLHSSVFPSEFDYVALGHIHYTSMVAGNPRIRYSGSPFVLGFDESGIPHYVLSVDCQKEKVPEVKKLLVPQILHFKRVSGAVPELVEQLMALSASPCDNLFLEICSKPELGLNIHEALEGALKDAPFTVANWKNMRTEAVSSGAVYDAGLDGAGQLTEKDIFSMLVKTKTGFDRDSLNYKKIMEELYPLFMEVSASLASGSEAAGSAGRNSTGKKDKGASSSGGAE